MAFFAAPFLVACSGDDDAPATMTSAPTDVAANTPGASATSPTAEPELAVSETSVDGVIQVAASAGDYLYVVTSMDVRDAAQLS